MSDHAEFFFSHDLVINTAKVPILIQYLVAIKVLYLLTQTFINKFKYLSICKVC
jgi:hypothetical protein